MKAKTIITKHLVWFTITTLLLSIGFKLFFSFLFRERIYVFADLVGGAVYGVSVAIAGWLFGEREARHLPINDFGFRYHLATFLVFNLVWGGCAALGWDKYKSIASSYGLMIIWGAFLLAHLVLFLRLRKKTIDGLDKEDIFE